jgi:hypothetical protein
MSLNHFKNYKIISQCITAVLSGKGADIAWPGSLTAVI